MSLVSQTQSAARETAQQVVNRLRGELRQGEAGQSQLTQQVTQVARQSLQLCLLALLTAPVFAQRADDNAVTAAEDAFGATIGNETIGLYSSTQVRGFSPVAAGNVRVEGLYIDRQATLPPRLVEGSAIRVGLSAQGYPFPAPTGIVDYRLQKAGNDRILSIVTARNAYEAGSIEVDGKFPIVRDRLGIAAGISYAHEEYYDGSNAPYVRAAVAPRWRPAEHVEVIPFWSIVRGRDEEVAPAIITAGSYLPPETARRRYFGQRWSDNETKSTNTGVVAKARIGSDWALAAGVFESVYDTMSGFAELYVDTTREGMTRELLIADPQQRYASTSGEVRVTRSITEGPRLHLLHATLRGRQQKNRYGGSASVDLGVRRLGEVRHVTEPESFAFGEQTRDVVDQSTVGLTYEGRWREAGEASLGLQHTDYEKRIDQPGLTPTVARDKPWLVNGAVAVHVSENVALYAGHTRGLEESGIAPDDAANRNEALPAIRTEQTDAGLRWTVSPELKLIAGVFNVEKPYFTTDERNVFTTAGTVRHRGIELSLTGTPTEFLSIVTGAVLMEPRVTGEAVTLGRVGDKPVGQTARNLRANVEYRPPAIRGLSLDAAVVNYGARTASRDGLNEVPGYTLHRRRDPNDAATASGKCHGCLCLVRSR
jgi:iron complex outermembrane receptor protein